MSNEDSRKVSLREFIEILQLFEESLRHDFVDAADEILKYARGIVDQLKHNSNLMESLIQKPETVKRLATNLLVYFHHVAEEGITKADNPHNSSEAQNQKIQLMWRLWPILHRLLILQIEAEHDSDDYTEKAAELYGIITQAMESPNAVKLLKAVYEDVFPLPHG